MGSDPAGLEQRREVKKLTRSGAQREPGLLGTSKVASSVAALSHGPAPAHPLRAGTSFRPCSSPGSLLPALWSDYLGGEMPQSVGREEMRPSPHPSRLRQPSLSQALRRRCPYSLRPDIPEIAAHNCTFPGQETSPAGMRGRLASLPLSSGSTEPADRSQMLRSARDLPGFRPQVRVTAWALAAGPLAWVERMTGGSGRRDLPLHFPLPPQEVQ